jgi:hypothetical protein
MSDTFIDLGLYASYIMTIIGAAAALIFPMIYLIKNPKNAKGALIGIVAIAVVFGLSYAVSGDEVRRVYEKFGVDAGQSKLIGSSLIALYILTIGAIAAAAYAEVTRFFK